MGITKIKLTNFTVFQETSISFSPGINIFIGANGTGKTHLLKLIYAVCEITKSEKELHDKIVNVFRPYKKQIGRLVRRRKGSSEAKAIIYRDKTKITLTFSNHAKSPEHVKVIGEDEWARESIACAYIPVKEMLAHAPGFRSLYVHREIQFEEIYDDVLHLAYLPPLRGPMDSSRKKLLRLIEREIQGKVSVEDEFFFLRNKHGNLEFSLLAEGLRKLAMLWILIQNGTLMNGSLLFWDEPEANLNPKVMGTIVEILLELQRNGVQIFLATHNYVVLKEFDLRMKKTDNIKFHSLYWDDETEDLSVKSTENFLHIEPNSIADTFTGIYDREVKRSLEKNKA